MREKVSRTIFNYHTDSLHNLTLWSKKGRKTIHDSEVAGYTSHICPRNAKMTDTARHTVLDWHNAFRSSIAFGKEEDGEGAYAPMAKNMLKMVIYSDDIEYSVPGLTCADNQ